jgi:hypothetical protein
LAAKALSCGAFSLDSKVTLEDVGGNGGAGALKTQKSCTRDRFPRHTEVIKVNPRLSIA